MKHRPHQIISGSRVAMVFVVLYFRLLFFLFKKYKSPRLVRAAFIKIQERLAVYKLENAFHKMVYHEGRYFISCNLPGYPSSTLFEKLLAIAQSSSTSSSLDNMGMVQIAFTKKCPLNCAHCYEGKVLNQPEGITLDEHLQIIRKLQAHQVSVIQFGGGEPLNRFDDLITVLHAANNTSDFWIYSSGYGLTQEKALLLKQSGLTGVSISIDHFEAEQHNLFRRNDKSYSWALAAVEHAKKANLLVTLSICVTNSFCSEENIWAYFEFAKSLQVDFVQILEPRSAGNFEGQNVLLRPENVDILEQFFVKVSTSSAFKKYPIVQYYGYQQRRIGCVGAAERYIYIDTDGCVQSCPFCSNKKSHFLYGDLQKDLNELKTQGCHYENPLNYEKSKV